MQVTNFESLLQSNFEKIEKLTREIEKVISIIRRLFFFDIYLNKACSKIKTNQEFEIALAKIQ